MVLLRVSLISLVIAHLLIVLVNLVAIPVLLIYEPWYVSVPLSSFLLRLATVERECPLTSLENRIRVKLGMKKIRSFIGHYIMKYVYILWGRTTKPHSLEST
jgi:hypothetical protein